MGITVNFRGRKKGLKERIINIASYFKETNHMKIKSFCIFLILGYFLLSQFSVITQMNYRDEYIFQEKNVVYEDLKNYFGNFDGSFVLYNMNENKYIIYNKKKSTKRISPDSTYKIYSALIGLEENVIERGNTALEWDGKKNSIEVWNRDQNLESALKYSVNWYFQKIDENIGKKQLSAYYRNISYGNYNLAGNTADYWLESSLKISPAEQVVLLKKMYTKEIGFSEENIETVKNAMKLSQNNKAAVYGKTGTGGINGENKNGWFVGFIEQKDNVYIFATNIQDKNNANGKNAAEITLAILKDKSIY